MTYFLLLIYYFIIILPLLWWWPNNSFAFQPFDPQLAIYAVAKAAALLGLPMLVLQLVLAARWPWVERWYGQDKLIRWHRLTGIIAVLLIIIHPVLLAGAYLMISLDALWTFITPTFDWKLVGQLSISLFILTAILAIWQVTFKLPYHWWKRIHYVVYLGILGGLLHAWFLGSDFMISPTLRWYWIGLFCLAGTALLYRHVLIPLLARRQPYRITALRTEAAGVQTIVLSPIKPTTKFIYQPGQFIFVQFDNAGVTKEWHPFTLSSSPTETNLQLSIKISGDWTSTLPKLAVGDRALLEGPFGRFSYALLPFASKPSALVFIAGGIGITPIRSMIRALVDRNENHAITLFYSCRSTQDIAFYDELKQLSNAGKIHLELFVNAGNLPGAQTERLTAGILQRYFNGDLAQKHYFICGPPPMMSALHTQLLHADVTKSAIHLERFALK